MFGVILGRHTVKLWVVFDPAGNFSVGYDARTARSKSMVKSQNWKCTAVVSIPRKHTTTMIMSSCNYLWEGLLVDSDSRLLASSSCQWALANYRQYPTTVLPTNVWRFQKKNRFGVFFDLASTFCLKAQNQRKIDNLGNRKRPS